MTNKERQSVQAQRGHDQAGIQVQAREEIRRFSITMWGTGIGFAAMIVIILVYANQHPETISTTTQMHIKADPSVPTPAAGDISPFWGGDWTERLRFRTEQEAHYQDTKSKVMAIAMRDAFANNRECLLEVVRVADDIYDHGMPRWKAAIDQRDAAAEMAYSMVVGYLLVVEEGVQDILGGERVKEGFIGNSNWKGLDKDLADMRRLLNEYAQNRQAIERFHEDPANLAGWLDASERVGADPCASRSVAAASDTVKAYLGLARAGMLEQGVEWSLTPYRMEQAKALGFTPTPQVMPTRTRTPDRGPTEEKLSVGEFKATNKGSGIGCEERGVLEKLIEYHVNNDQEAWKRALTTALATGECTEFNPGEVVFLVDTAIFSGLVKVRRKGEVTEYWTFKETILR